MYSVHWPWRCKLICIKHFQNEMCICARSLHVHRGALWLSLRWHIFCFKNDFLCCITLWIQLVKTSSLCHKVIFCILNKMAGNLCARKCWGDIFWRRVWISGRRGKSSSQSILAPVCYSVCYWVTSICSSGDSAISHALLDYAKHHQCFLTVSK